VGTVSWVVAGSLWAADVTWTGAAPNGQGLWQDGANWDTGTPPGERDTARSAAGSLIVRSAAAKDTVQRLLLDGSLRISAGNLTDNTFRESSVIGERLEMRGGSLDWREGLIVGGGLPADGLRWSGGLLGSAPQRATTLSVRGDASTISGTELLVLNSTLRVQGGKLEWRGESIELGKDRRVENTGVWVDRVDAGKLHELNFGGTGRFANDGTYRKVGAGFSTVKALGNDRNGQVLVEDGVLVLPRLSNLNAAGDVLDGGSYVVNDGALLQIQGAAIQTNRASIGLVGTGRIGGAQVDALAGLAANPGNLALDAGARLSVTGPLDNTGQLFVQGKDSRLQVAGTFTNTGRVKLDGQLRADAVILEDGLLEGGGSVILPAGKALRLEGGELHPTGALAVDGGLRQTGGVLRFGLSAPNVHDRLSVTGSFSLQDGAIEADFSFAAAIGSQFKLIGVGDLLILRGTSALTVRGLPADRDAVLVAAGKGLELHVIAVPEPGALLMWAAGLAALVVWRRRTSLAVGP
jgi:hypothetical protein